jgi:hypothetical protein
MSDHDVVGSIAVKHLRVFVPLGVLTLQGPTKPTCTISHVVVSAIFTCYLSYCSLLFFNTLT